MDTYSGYNKIPMNKRGRVKTYFMTEQDNYQYNVMPLILKNVDATYQRMMNKIFQEEIWEMMELCMDDMIIKPSQEEIHAQHLQLVFKRVRNFNMCLNLEKFTFGVRDGKFLGF